MKKAVKIQYLQGKKLAILGLGAENQALLKFLVKNRINPDITICDKRQSEELGDKYIALSKKKNISWRLGEKFNKELYRFDLLSRSPGWPIGCPGIQEALKRGKTGLTSPMKLFFDLCPTRNIIGVTGTKGKGTTASLIQAMLKAGKKRAWLGGNIGVAPFDFFGRIRKDDWVVLELSSFQLEDMESSPHIAVFTNFYSEHLAPADPNNPNYHPSLKAYWQAKANILVWQQRSDYAIFNPHLRNRAAKLPPGGKKIYFGKSGLPSRLMGEHNKENIAAAAEAAKLAGIKAGDIAKAVASFRGLEYRLELVGEAGGIKFYNDSFATTPEATITALKSFEEPVVLLAGGADKGADFKKLAKEIKKRVKTAVLLDGRATPAIRKELAKIGFLACEPADNIYDAVGIAYRAASSGDVVLLSTACASFGMFRNYKERGKLFNEAVARLK